MPQQKQDGLRRVAARLASLEQTLACPSRPHYDSLMGSLGEVIRDAFSDAKVPPTLAARMIGVDDARLAELMSGTQIPTPLELDAVAQTFGITVQELQAGEAASSPLRDLFFRAESEGCGRARDLMIDLGVHRVLGEFVRCSRDAAELAQLLGDGPAPALPEPPASILAMLTDRPPHGGDRVAEWFRQEMGLGTEPIPSLRVLVERLGTVFRFGKATRAALISRAAQHWYGPDHPDRITDGIGLRADVVRHLAERAFVAGKLDALRVREYLRVPLTEPPPSDWQGVDPSRLAPLRTVSQRVLGIVEQFVLDEIDPDTPLRPVDCEPSEGGWRVTLATASGEGRGHVIVGYDLDHVEPHLLDVA